MRIHSFICLNLILCGLTVFSSAQRTPLKPTNPASASTTSEKKQAQESATKTQNNQSTSPHENQKKESTETPSESPHRVSVRWFGHSFAYITTTTGVRISIDPYGESLITYPFPQRLQSDVVLISNESDAYSSAERIFGNPLVFRSITSIGLNRASGFTFKGIQTFKDREKGKREGSNTIYTFTVDNLRFAHLGHLGHPLDSRLREEIGAIDILFIPVGLKTLAVEEWRRIANELRARIIIPITYATSFNANIPLRPLDEFLQGQTNVIRLKSDGFEISQQELPTQPSFYIPQFP